MRALVRRTLVIAMIVLCSIAGLSSVAQAATPLTPGTPVHISLAPSVSASFTVNANAGQALAFDTTLTTLTSYQLNQPDGSLWATGALGNAGTTSVDWSLLPQSGSWTFTLTGGPFAADFDLTARVLDDAVQPVTPGAFIQNLTVAHQTIRRTFALAAGQRMSLQVLSSALTTPGGPGQVDIRLVAPGQTDQAGQSLGAVGDQSEPRLFQSDPAAASTGIYTLVFDPETAATGSISFVLATFSDLAPALSPGRAQRLDFTARGQRAVFTFAGTAGQRPVIRVSSPFSPEQASQYETLIFLQGPDGRQLPLRKQQFLWEPDGTLNASGTWTITIYPPGSAAGSMTVAFSLVTDQVLTPALGSTVTVKTSTPGQNVHLGVNLAAGQRMVIREGTPRWRRTADSGSGSQPGAGLPELYGADGSTDYFAESTQNYLESAPADVAGRYDFVVNPFDDSVGSQSYIITIGRDVVRTLTPERQTTISLNRGEDGYYHFTSATGGHFGVSVAAEDWRSGGGAKGSGRVNLSLSPADGSSQPVWVVYNGTVPAFADPGLIFAAVKEYVLKVDPDQDSAGSITVTLHQPVDQKGSVVLGRSTFVRTTVAGENDQLAFTGTQGKTFSVKVSQQSWTSAQEQGAGSTYVSLIDPAGVLRWSELVPAKGGTLTGPVLDQGGRWTFLVDPVADTTGSMLATPDLR